MSVRDVTRAMLAALDAGEPTVLATVVRASGSTPQAPGARMLLHADGRTVGTVGGGAIERAILDEMRVCLRDRRPRLVTRDLARDLGMCCGGRMEVFVEPVEPTQRLFIFGAGHVAKPLAEAARMLAFHVTVIDDREELNAETRFPGCRRILAEPKEAAKELAPTDQDWIVIVTHDHRLDEEALDQFARTPHRYVGVIGSRRKVFRILARIAARGPLPDLSKVYAPIGLDIGAVSPEEIGISIAAELVALRHGKPGHHMRAVDDPRLAKVLSGELSPESVD